MFDKIKSVDEKLSPGLRKIVRNIGWLSAEKVLSMILSFFVGVYVIRYLGSDNFGKLSYSISFVALFIAISKLGLDQIVVRNLVKQECSDAEILGTAFILKLIGSLIAVFLVYITIFQFNTEIQIRKITVIIAISLIFSSFDVLDLWFQSQVLSKSTAIVRSFQFIVSSVAKLCFIYFRLPLVAFAYLLLVDSIIVSVGMVLVYFHKNQSILRWKIKKAVAIKLLKDSCPLILSGVMVTVYLKIDQVMLGNMSSSQEVGNYAAAVKFSEIWYFIPMTICTSVFPSIIKAKENSKSKYHEKLQQLYDLMAILSFAVAIVITLISDKLVLMLLGQEYVHSGQILSIHIWSGLFIFLGLIRNQWLIAENLVIADFLTRAIGAFGNIVLNLLLIPHYGGIGAAIATIISYAFYAYFSCFLIPKLNRAGIAMTKSLIVPSVVKRNKLLVIENFQKLFKNQQI